MQELNYEEIQSKIDRPSRLCLHCERCMPIVDGENLKYEDIASDAIRGPLSIWDEYPEECGFTGWLFQEREKQKHAVRKIKEQIHYLSFLEENSLVDKNTTAKEKIEALKKQISPWYKHGADNW